MLRPRISCSASDRPCDFRTPVRLPPDPRACDSGQPLEKARFAYRQKPGWGSWELARTLRRPTTRRGGRKQDERKKRVKPPHSNTTPTETPLTATGLKRQVAAEEKLGNRTRFGARSQENRRFGFRPAFFDAATGTVYDSCFADGRPAPVHVLDGLPDEVVAERDSGGEVIAARESVVAGFVRHGCFYSREEAAVAVSADLRVASTRRARWRSGGRLANATIARMGSAA